jgi:hypothetical protein
VRQKLLNLGPSELRNLRTLKPGGSVVRTERNETRFVLAKVKSQSRPASGEWRSRTEVSESNDSPTIDPGACLLSSYNSIQSVI